MSLAPSILEWAPRPLRTPPATLAALHLAGAVAARKRSDPRLAFVTDVRLGQAARATGLAVVGL